MKADRTTTISQTQLAKLTSTSKADVAEHLANHEVELGKDGYNLFKSIPLMIERKVGVVDARSSMDAKLDEDRLFTQTKRLHLAGDLVELEVAERVAAAMAATVSNTVDSWGLDRKRRNDLMDRIAADIAKAWSGEEEDEDEDDD